MEVIRKYTPEQAEGLRSAIIAEHITPVIKEVFDKHPKIQAAILSFAQYWSDEANDAVYPSITFALEKNPDYKAHINKLNQSYFYENYGWQESCKWSDLVEGPAGFEVLGVKDERLDFRAPHWKPWPGNNDAISAFAPYCLENIYGPGTYSYDEAPYCLFRREEKQALSIEVVGEMIRPWLDGVMPEMELPDDH